MTVVAGVGRLNVDLIYHGLAKLPQEGEEVYSDGFYMGLGGGIPGSLVSLRRLGVDVRLGSWLGEDYVSQFAQDCLKQEGITPINLYRGEGKPVNITSAMVTPNDRTFVTYGSMAADADPQAVYDVCKGADYVLMQLATPQVYQRLKQEGSTLILDPGYDSEMSIQTYKDYLEVADWYLPNRKEAAAITGQTSYEDAAVMLSQFGGKAIVKLDSGGAYLYQNGIGEIIETVPTLRKDSTGAGDAFLSGFVYGLANNYGAKTAIMCGNIAGANCVSDYGCLSAKLDRHTLQQQLQKYYGISV